jgi:hypothetical protein
MMLPLTAIMHSGDACIPASLVVPQPAGPAPSSHGGAQYSPGTPWTDLFSFQG